MVYHGFKGDKDIDEILQAQKNKSQFIKQAIKSYVPQTESKEEARMQKIVVQGKVRRA